jgi:G3E family GTPase
MDSNKIPVSLITGFLGSGKTTLLNQVLNNPNGRKYAVIVNEFGEIGIDNDLVIGADEEIFELNNGCVCCNVRGDLIRILSALFKRKGAFDAILIETTGLANPAPVAQTFFADDDIARKAKLDGIICVVDAANIIENLKEFEEATNQIAFADIVILNKIDLVNPNQKQDIIKSIKNINLGVKIIEAQRANFDIENILALNSYDGFNQEQLNAFFPQEEQTQHHHHDDHHCDENCKHDHIHTHNHKAHNHLEQNGVRALAIKSEKLIDEKSFLDFLSSLIDDFGGELLRFKGIIKIANNESPFTFNGVHMMVDAQFDIKKLSQNIKESRLVFIGKNLPEEEIISRFKLCEIG